MPKTSKKAGPKKTPRKQIQQRTKRNKVRPDVQVMEALSPTLADEVDPQGLQPGTPSVERPTATPEMQDTITLIEVKEARPIAVSEVQSPPPLFDADDLTYLLTTLQAHDQNRQLSSTAKYADGQVEVLQAICLALIAGPSELGGDILPSPLRDWAYAHLRNVGSGDIPEARACRLWLSCALGEMKTDASDEFASLANKSLWEPVSALVYRGLAYYGRRGVLADALPKDGPLTLVQADAWLEASHVADAGEGWINRIARPPDGVLPPAVYDRWAALLASEAALAFRRDDPEALTAELTALLNLVNEQSPRTYAEAEAQRLAARAAAALVRVRLAQQRDDGGVLAQPSGQLLPDWERHYLQALARWQLDDQLAVADGLKIALELNPSQSSVRLALAVCLACNSPEEALAILVQPEPTWETGIAQAALLARLKRYADAEQALAHSASAGGEPLRYAWHHSRTHYRLQVQALRAALAERHRDWEKAQVAWRAACVGAHQKTKLVTREIFIARRELEALPPGLAWRRDWLKRRWEYGWREIGSMPLIGDALFFRAAASVEAQPERASRDFTTLLRRRTWVEADGRVGGERIIYAGDALMRLGQIGEAIRAYELAGTAARERLAVALLYADIQRPVEPAALCRTVDRAVALAPASPWPLLLAAWGLTLAGDAEAAPKYLQAASERGAPEAAVRSVQLLGAVLVGGATVAAEELAALHLPPEVESMLGLLSGTGTQLERLETFIQLHGAQWMARCPLDPARLSRHLLSVWSEAGQWDKVLLFAQELSQVEQLWAVELAGLVYICRALERAGQNALAEAEQALHQAASILARSVH